jgi:hypothetical protein
VFTGTTPYALNLGYTDGSQMRASEKIALTDRIARELESRYDYREIDAYLGEFGIQTPHNWNNWDNKREYSKIHLYGESTDKIIGIAEDLGIDDLHSRHGISSPPQCWGETTCFRLFISHVAKDKDKATRLRDCLLPYEISGFVAHEDIDATLEWQLEIERALYTMDGFLAIHTKGFRDSYWAQQEVGFALGRGVKIISFKMDEDPTGFISKHQALARKNRTAEQIAAEVDTLLSNDPLTSTKLTLAKKNNSLDEEIPF